MSRTTADDREGGVDSGGAAAGLPAPGPDRRDAYALQILSDFALVGAAVLMAVSLVAIWGRYVVMDTDRWVEAVGPLAQDPIMQDAFADAIGGVFVPLLDPDGPLVGELPPIVRRLVTPLLSRATEFLDAEIREFVEQQDFQSAWEDLNRAAHSEWVALVMQEPDGGRVLVADDDALAVRLDSLAVAIQQRLVDRGLGVMDRLPFDEVGGEVVLLRSPWVGRTFALLRTAWWLSWVLPALSAAVVAAAIATAPSRARSVAVLGASMALAALVALLYSEWIQAAIAGAGAAFGLGEAATDLIVDAVAEPLRTWLQGMIALGALLATGAAAWLFRRRGGAPAARRAAMRES